MDNSGANTVILVLILIVVLGGIFWLYGGVGGSDTESIDVNVDLPTGGTNNGTGTN